MREQRPPRMSGIECERWISSSSKGPSLHLLPRRQLLQRRVAELVLVELGADHADRQQAAVDHRRHADLAQHVGQRADVVLVAVGEDDRLDVVGAVAQVGEVGQDEVDPEHLGGREHQAGVDDDDPAVVLDDGHVLADLPQPAERQHAELAWHELLSSRLSPASEADALERRPASRPAARRRPATSGSRSGAGAIRPSISSAAFTGIGLVVTASRLVERAQARRRSRAPARCRRPAPRPRSPASAAPTRCEATRMPPAPPNSSVAQEDVVVAGEDRQALDRPQLVVVGLLDRDDVVDLRQLAEQLGADVDDHPRGDVVERPSAAPGPPRRPPRSGRGSRPGWACCSRA